MKMYAALALAALAFSACSKDSPAGRIAEGVDKSVQEGQLRSQKWVSTECSTAGLAWTALGASSSNVIMDFQGGGVVRTLQYFSSGDCNQANLIGQVAYTGTADVSTETSFDKDARVLDLNYTTGPVTVTIATDEARDRLNSALVPSCGINDWAVGQGRNIPLEKIGGLDCPLSKPAQMFDVFKTDGQTLFFGDSSGAQNGSTPELRPTSLDTAHGYRKM